MEKAKQLIWDKDPAGVPALCEAFKNDVTTTKLDLTRLRIGDEGAAALAEALRVNCTLKELHLVNNNIGDEGAAALAEALKVNCTLKELHLFNNSIGAREQLRSRRRSGSIAR